MFFAGRNSLLQPLYNLVMGGRVFPGMLCYSVHPVVQQVICSHEGEGGWRLPTCFCLAQQ